MSHTGEGVIHSDHSDHELTGLICLTGLKFGFGKALDHFRFTI